MAALFSVVRLASDVVAEVWPRTPQQCHGTSDMRGRHGRAAKTHVSTIGGVIAGTSAVPARDIRLDAITSIDVPGRGANIRFYSITPIDGHGAAAAKEAMLSVPVFNAPTVYDAA